MKKRILFIDDDDSIRLIYSMHLEKFFSHDLLIKECLSGKQAIQELDKNKEYDLIICDYNMEDGNGNDVFIFLKNQGIKIPFLLFSSDEGTHLPKVQDLKKLNPKNDLLKKPAKLDIFKEKIYKMMNLSPDKEIGYTPIRLFHFYRFNHVLCDIYVKLNDNKYVKIINENENYNVDEIKKFKNKKQSFFYIKSSKYKKFSKSCQDHPFLIENKKIKPEKIQDAILQSCEVIQEMITTIGVSPSVIKIVDRSIEELNKDIQKGSQIEDLLRKLRNRKNYLNDHTMLLSYLACQICSKLHWTSNETRKKICYAAIFHDITLENPDMALMADLDIPLSPQYGRNEIEKFKRHPLDIVNILSSSEGIPPNVETIIMQHHEHPNQTGFPRGLDSHQISQLVGVFIVAHRFISEVYYIDFNEKKYQIIINKMNDLYLKGHYKEPMMALDQLYKSFSFS